jgi:type VI secretion system protein ImpG
MDALERLYEDFLSEMDALEHFRQRFAERHPAAPLDREDPDVRRLIESMAFFSVQTRQATLRSLRSVWWRLFSGFFDFMVEPVPSAVMAQALPTEKMVEPVVLPRGTEFRLAPQGEAPGFFRTRRELRVLPVFLEGTQVLPLEHGGHRLILRFASRFARKDEVGLLSLHVRHLEDYRSSLAVFHALCRHLRQASVVYNEPADEHSVGEVCEVSFGRSASPAEDSADFAHPFRRIRSFFHFPEQQLFIHLQVPPSRKPWSSFCLCFDLEQQWTTGRSLHPEFLQPFVVPLDNLKAEPAHPIFADGTRSQYPILNISAGGNLRLHSINHVYEVTAKGRSLLRPAFLPGEGPSYEVEESLGADLAPQHSLLIRMPEAFTTPRRVVVEALWHQPQFASRALGRIQVSTPGRYVEGLRWQLLGDVLPAQDSPLHGDLGALTQLLAWKSRPTLSRNEFLALLMYLGTPARSPLARVIPWVRDLTVSTVPDSALRGSGLQHVYEILLEPFEPGFEPLVVCFLQQAREVLDSWNSDAAVELRATVAGAGPLPLLVAA